MDPLQRLIAMEDIRAVKARYFRCVDTKDWAALAAVFTPDIVFDRTHSGSIRDPWSGEGVPPVTGAPVLVRGREAVVAMIRGVVENLITVHHGHMPEFTFEADDAARVIWAMSDELRDRERRLILTGRGHYHELYRRSAEGWAIAACKLVRLTVTRGDATGA